MTLSTTRKFKGYENFTLKIDAVTGQKQPKITGWQNQKGAKLVTMESAAVTKAVLTGKVGGVTVIDFDSEPAYILFTMDFPFLLDTFRVKTKKGYHCYIEYGARFKTDTDVMIKKYPKVDILNDKKFALAPPTTYKHIDGKTYGYTIDHDVPILKLTEEQIQLLLDQVRKEGAPTPLLLEPTIKPLSADSKAELAELGDLIKVEYLDNYSDWLKLVWSLASVNQYDLALTLSQKSDKFEQKEFDKVYNNNKNRLSIGTFYRYCKLSDFDRYVEIKGFSEIENNDASFADTFLKLEGDNVIYNCMADEMFIYNGSSWVRDTKKCNVLKKTLRVVLDQFISSRIKALQSLEGNTEEAIKAKSERTTLYNKMRLQLTKRRVIDDVVELLKQDLSYSADGEVQFDTCVEQLYNLHFKNGVYELNTGLFRDRFKSDHVTTFLGWSFNPARDESKIAAVKEEFAKIQPDESQLKFTLGWLAYCLDGDTGLQKCKFNIGYTAQNGKSTEFKIHSKVFPMYSRKLDNSTFDAGKQKRHKQFIHLIRHPIRFAYMEELSRKNLDVDTLKDFIDGDKLNVEIMFGTSETKNIQAKLISCSNKDFSISNSDKGMARRGTVQFYRSKFLKGDEQVDPSKHIYPRVDNYENTFDSEEYKNAYLHLLLDYYDRSGFIPSKNENHFQDLVDDYDVFTGNFDKVFVSTGDVDDVVNRDDALESFNAMSGKSQYGWKSFLSEMKRVGVEYDRAKKSDKVKGCFLGLKVVAFEDEVQNALD